MPLPRPSHLIVLLSLAACATPASAESWGSSFHDSAAFEATPRLRAGAAVTSAYGTEGRDHTSFHSYRASPHGRSSVVAWPLEGTSGATYGTSGATGGSFAVIAITGPEAAAGTAEAVDREASPVRFVDVESARLDRRSYGADGLDVVRVGTAKIIRIAPEGARAAQKDDVRLPELDGGGFAALSPAEQAVTVYPDTQAPAAPLAVEPPAVATPTPRPQTSTSQGTGPAFEPWTPEWLRDCVDRHPGFDASLGTYTDENGRRRFCTGEL